MTLPASQPSREQIGQEWSVMIKVIDSADGHGIEAARVAFACEGEVTEVMTDSEGAAFACGTSQLSEDWSLTAEAAGYTPLRQVFDPTHSALELCLSSIDSIRGSVSRRSGRPVGPGVYVLCKDSDARSPSAEEFRAALSGESRSGFLMTCTDEEGRFAFGGLSTSSEYDLRAGGEGVLADSWMRRVRASSQPITIFVDGVYGSLLMVVGQDGKDIHLSPEFLRQDGGRLAMRFWTRSGNATPMLGDDLGFAMAGGKLGPSFSRPFDELVLLVSPDAADEVGPNFVQYDVPGYRTKKVEFWSQAIHGELDVVDVELEQICEGWGKLEIAATGVSNEVMPYLAETGYEGFLVLVTEGIREDWIPASIPLRGDRSLEGLPQGDYHLYFRDLQGLRLHPHGETGATVRIGEKATRVEFDFSTFGGLLFDPVDDKGRAYEGPFIVDVAVGSPRLEGSKMFMDKASHYTFSTRPYCIPSLSAGLYCFQVGRPVVEYAVDPRYQSIEVLQGVIQDIPLHWKPQKN